jgi:cell wall-associated NlpC family hydrolase
MDGFYAHSYVGTSIPSWISDQAVIQASKSHAIAVYPHESCGIVTAAGFVPLVNVHETPTEAFDCCNEALPYQKRGEVLGLIHSHPHAPGASNKLLWPSSGDMIVQESWGLPWGLISTDGVAATTPYFWGDCLPEPPIIGREFRPGPSGTDGRGDCYAVIRAWFKEHRGVKIPDIPRDWRWWETENIKAGDIYEDNFRACGFREVRLHEIRPGDCALIGIQTSGRRGAALPLRANHAAVYVGNGQIIHHKPGRRSCQEPIGLWTKFVFRWLRHACNEDAPA